MCVFKNSKPHAEIRICPCVRVDAQFGGIEAEYEREVFEFTELELISIRLRAIDGLRWHIRSASELIRSNSQGPSLVPKCSFDRAATGKQHCG